MENLFNEQENSILNINRVFSDEPNTAHTVFNNEDFETYMFICEKTFEDKYGGELSICELRLYAQTNKNINSDKSLPEFRILGDKDLTSGSRILFYADVVVEVDKFTSINECMKIGITKFAQSSLAKYPLSIFLNDIKVSKCYKDMDNTSNLNMDLVRYNLDLLSNLKFDIFTAISGNIVYQFKEMSNLEEELNNIYDTLSDESKLNALISPSTPKMWFDNFYKTIEESL